MGFAAYFTFKTIGSSALSEFISLKISIGVSGLVYLLLIYLLKIEEIDWFIKIIKEKLGKT